MAHIPGLLVRPRASILLGALLVMAGTVVHAEGESRHDESEAAATHGPQAANAIAACFGAYTLDPLASCPGGTLSALTSVNFGVNTPIIPNGGGGAGGGKAVFLPLVITKAEDSNTQVLLQKAFNGQHFQFVCIGFYDATGKLERQFQFELVAVTALSYSNTVAPGGAAIETATLTFGAFQTTP